MIFQKTISAIILAIPLLAQTSTLDMQLIPASPTTALTTTASVKEIRLTNETTADVQCTIKNRATTPRTLFDDYVRAKLASGGSAYVLVYPNGVLMTGGVTWSCSSGTAVTGSIVYLK